MKVAIPKEIAPGERRVAATPETVKKLAAAGMSVAIEAGAGTQSDIADRDFQAAGATLVTDAVPLLAEADLVLKVQKPMAHPKLGKEEVDLIRPGAFLISFLQPMTNLDLVKKLAARKVTALALDLIPRIARAQKLDALSSQSNIAGYKAVLLAANAFGRIFPMMMTAAGTILPARVLVIGAGVAGLQAIATAKRLGAVVEAFDTRPIVKEQVESLGAKFVQLEIKEKETETKEGYAKELSAEDHAREMELIAQHVGEADIVITTALVPGKPAPRLIPEEAVRKMRPGSVIVDLASEAGGNCALTESGKETVKDGVKIFGFTHWPSLMAAQSSQMLARNILNLVLEIVRNGNIELNLKDEIVQAVLVTHNGEIVHPSVKKIL